MSVIASKKIIRKEVQLAADEYVQLHKQKSDIERRMKALREIVEPYMAENSLTIIPHSEGMGAVVIYPQNRPEINARFTTYEIEDVLSVAAPVVVSETIVERVDTKVVEYFVATNRIPKSVEQFKRLTTTHAFSAR